jgi:predicted negative regulator of RcsB-dependent stress response
MKWACNPRPIGNSSETALLRLVSVDLRSLSLQQGALDSAAYTLLQRLGISWNGCIYYRSG